MHDDEKRAAALAAIEEVRAGMLVGLGTGTTAAYAIRALGERAAQGLSFRAVATSYASADLARKSGITVIDFADIARVDLTIDGADQIDTRLFAVKGAGGALLREKAVAAASGRMVVIADGSKCVAAIDGRRVPVELLGFAQASALTQLAALGATTTLRVASDGTPYRTDGDNPIADCVFPDLSDPEKLAARIDAVPGVLGHGLFLHEIDAAYIATGQVVTTLERDRAAGDGKR